MSACAYVFMCAHINFFQTINYTYDQQLIAEDQTSAMLNHCTSPHFATTTRNSAFPAHLPIKCCTCAQIYTRRCDFRRISDFSLHVRHEKKEFLQLHKHFLHFNLPFRRLYALIHMYMHKCSCIH